MAKKIIRHMRAKKMAYLLSLTAVAVAFGFYLSFFGSHNAEAVSGVALTDPDTTGFGLDGRDFKVSWTPGAQPGGYMNTSIYIVSSSITLTTSTVSVNACNGSPCTPIGFFTNYQMATFTLPQYLPVDSAETEWSTSTQYVAWVYVMANTSTIVSSSPASVTFDSVSDSNAPFIEHMSVHTARAGRSAVINAFVDDDQTSLSQFGNPSDGGLEYFKLFYGTDVSSSSTSTDGILLPGDELAQFIISTSSVPAASSTFEYYLAARDGSSNVRYFCANFNAVTASDCQSNPFVVNVVNVSGQGRTVSGDILSGGSGLDGAKVFAGGFAGASISTNASGTYSFSGLPNNNSFDIVASKSGYCRAMRFETIGAVDKTGVNMNLNQGDCSFAGGDFEGGFGGMGGGSPQVIFSGPPDGMSGVPLGDTIRVGFNQGMNAATINDNMATGTSDNIYLTTDDGTTKVAGSVLYCENNGSPGCSSLFSMDQNVILFAPSAPFTTNTFYTLVITERVLSTSGQPVQGNRPGGGHRINFSTSGGTLDMGSFGQSGQFMPPYVMSMTPAPGASAAPNGSIAVEFNKAMNSASVNSTNITLHDMNNSGASVSLASVTLDSNESRFATIRVATGTLQAGREYELRVKGALASSEGMTMRSTGQTDQVAFSSSFSVSSGGNDLTAPTIYPMTASGTTGMAVNTVFEFGFNEQLSYSTINTNNITVRRGATAVAVDASYNSSDNTILVASNNALAPNTVYTITFGPGITDLAGNAIATSSYIYTTGGADTTLPLLREARCDDFTCKLFFSEAMNRDSRVDSNWASSTLNHANIALTQGGPDKVVTGTAMTYNMEDNSVDVQGVALNSAGGAFTLVISGVVDLSGNVVSSTSIIGTVENSGETFGSFGGTGMFGPPTTDFMGGGGIGQGEFTPQGFGNFTADQFAMGLAVMAFPFNPMASQDSNVFQVRFSPDVVLQDNDQVVITFPNGTTVTNAALDTFSPFNSDFNQFADGTVTGTAISANNTTREVTITLGVDGTPRTTDNITIDTRRIINPSIPKDFETGGYTVTIKVTRSGQVLSTKTSMPYFITVGGSNILVIDVVAGSSTSSPSSGANGNLFIYGGGPGGPINKQITLTDGDISAVDGDAATLIQYTGLPNGCYFIGTEPFVTLGGADYFGQMSPEPVCLEGGQSRTKYLLLTPSSGAGAVTTTVKLVGADGNPFNFSGADLDIFAGGPGRFVVKTLENLGAANASGYTLRLPANGHWFVGVGPAMPKGASAGMPTPLPAVPPPPIDIETRGVGTGSATVSLGMGRAPQGVSFDDSTDTITFIFAAADKTVTGTVRDGSGNPMNEVQVFMHRQGFGAPAFGTTNASGTFSLAVSDYGMYEIGAWKNGMPPNSKQMEVRVDGIDAGSAPDIYLEGKQITGANPLILKLRKASYTISGKILDNNNEGVDSAPVFASDVNGNMVFGNSEDGGNFSLSVDAGNWTIRAEMPPSKSDTCGRLSRVVEVTTESKSGKNLTPSASTCYTLSGRASVGSSTLANAPLFIEEWNTTDGEPIMGGMRRNVTTDSNGDYAVEVAGNTTYRIGTLHPDYGELSATKAVASADAEQNLSIAATTTLTLTFTGGTAGMDALIELKNSTNSSKRIGQAQNGLDSAVSLTGESGVTYNYFIDVFGVGRFTGTVTSSATINLGVSAGDFITVTGTIYSNVNTSTLEGTLVTFVNTSTGAVVTTLADENGTYSVDLKTGAYIVGADQVNYLTVPTTTPVTFTTNTAGYDFGGSNPDRDALDRYDYLIEGVVSSSAGAAMTDGHVWATNASGTTVTAPIDPSDGSYSLPVTAGSWTVTAVGPLHTDTTSTVTVTSADVESANFALTASSTLAATSTTGIISSDSGGTINDIGGSGIKLTAGQGVLATDDQDVTLTLERSYSAPDTANFQALGNANFSISAQGDLNVQDLTGNVDIQLNYTDLLGSLPSGVTESDLKMMYYSTEADQYIPVEGGYTIDATNNIISGAVDHFTDFVITYVAPASGSGGEQQQQQSSPAGGGSSASDTIPPANTSIVIAAGASTTANAAVTLTLAATDATSMMISNTSSFPGGLWETYATSKAWTLTSGVGAKTVYAKFRDSAGNASSPVSDAITLTAASASTTTTATTTTTTTSTLVTPTITATPAAPAAVVATPAPRTSVVSYMFRRALKIGSTGADVRKLQEKLKALGHYTYSSITGFYGRVTANAVSALQRAQGWRPVGVVGPKTLELLNGL